MQSNETGPDSAALSEVQTVQGAFNDEAMIRIRATLETLGTETSIHHFFLLTFLVLMESLKISLITFRLFIWRHHQVEFVIFPLVWFETYCQVKGPMSLGECYNVHGVSEKRADIQMTEIIVYSLTRHVR